jgi:hypothetical protein
MEMENKIKEEINLNLLGKCFAGIDKCCAIIWID